MKTYGSFTELAAANGCPTCNTFNATPLNNEDTSNKVAQAHQVRQMIQGLESTNKTLEAMYQNGDYVERKYGGRAADSVEKAIYNLNELLDSDSEYKTENDITENGF